MIFLIIMFIFTNLFQVNSDMHFIITKSFKIVKQNRTISVKLWMERNHYKLNILYYVRRTRKRRLTFTGN